MDEQRYRAWRAELDHSLAVQPIDPPGAGSTAANARAALNLARRVSRALAASLGQDALTDKNSYDFILERLDKLVEFETLSLAEYTYHPGGDQHPGIRLWLDALQWHRRLGVILFDDVRQWRLDHSGARSQRRLVSLDLSGPAPALLPDGELATGPLNNDWQLALVEGLCRPVRLFF